MSISVRISKGKNISIQGSAQNILKDASSDLYSLNPIDFNLLIPKLCVRVGDKVLAGEPLFFDKENDSIKYCSPVSGLVKEIVRGAKRKILRVVVKADKKNKYKKFNVSNYQKRNVQEIKDLMMNSGLWALIQKRPFSIVAEENDQPKSIFISCFDSSPLAPDYNFILSKERNFFQIGLDIMSMFTTGKLHLNVDGNRDDGDFFKQFSGCQVNKFFGPHPSGNVGVQIHHIDPINKGDVVWVLSPQSIVIIGRFFSKGLYDMSKTIALTGSEVKVRNYYKIIQGLNIGSIVKNNLKKGEKRFISGNVLSGRRIEKDGFISFFDDQVTVIPEGNYYQLFGWALPGFHKYSFSRLFFSWLNQKKDYALDSNMNGEERAFVVSGQYENLFPMDIYPVHLIKAIMAQDIELMEQLGIYEVDPADFSLCEFACTSKMPVQEIVREGLDLIKKEC